MIWPAIWRLPTPMSLRAGNEKRPPPGTFFDAATIDILTTSSIRKLQKYVPDVLLDVRRFRPNLLIDDDAQRDDVRERDWIGAVVGIGSAKFTVVREAPRCTMIAAEQAADIPRHSPILRAIVKEMKQALSVYCDVKRPGFVKLGEFIFRQEA
ncbi:MOSC domain-containing protein [Sphingobium sp.]|uniref:MOSC domain-containing protein n=1 Tax=Sphingobium sp. TaxID=1912891 RepID=UPI0039B8D985